MRLNEISEQLGLSKRAIKYYEEQGFVHVKKDENGYRNYTDANVQRLKEIAAYRKLGISIGDIKLLLEKEDKAILEKVLKQKQQNLDRNAQEIAALKEFLDTHDTGKLYQCLDYENVAHAIQEAVPGFYGYYFLHHFLPYLKLPIENKEQEEAYHAIVSYWDHTEIKLPFLMKLIGYLLYKMQREQDLYDVLDQTEATIQMYLHPNAEEYEKLKQHTMNNMKKQRSLWHRYSIPGIMKRKLMREMKDKGYYDIFLPNMAILSPKYKEYLDALQSLNTRICQELGVYYDSKYHLIQLSE